MTALQIEIPDALIDELAQRMRDQLSQPATSLRWLTVRAAAAHLGLSGNAIRALIKRDRIPFYKVEGRILLEQNELDSWVRSGGKAT